MSTSSTSSDYSTEKEQRSRDSKPLNNEKEDEIKQIEKRDDNGGVPLLETILNESDVTQQGDVKSPNSSRDQKSSPESGGSGWTEETEQGNTEVSTTKEEEGETLEVDRKADRFLERPKTAKLGRPRTRHSRGLRHSIRHVSTSSSGETGEEEKQRATSTSSWSSVDTFEGKKRKSEQNRFNENDENKIRELLLHRYLDRHLVEELEQHRSYFRQGYSTEKKPEKRKPSGKRGKRSDPTSVRLAKSAYGGHQATLLSYNSPRQRETEVRRNIRKLVAELAKITSSEMDRKPPLPARKGGRKGAPSCAAVEGEGNSTPDRAASEDGSNQSSRPAVRVVLPAEAKEEEEEEATSVRRSILKTEQGSRTAPGKHVTLPAQAEPERLRHLRSPNHVDPFAHLCALLGQLDDADYVITDDGGALHRVTLRSAPLRPSLGISRRPATAFPARRKKGEKAEGKPRKLRIKSEEKKKEEFGKDKDREEADKTELKHSPRIRPGTAPIKCNWVPEKFQTPVAKFSDHQLKNSDNPAVLEWLAHKNALARKERVWKVRENRTKREKLMTEFNEKEDHRANALVEYERWKKKKNREILLRRRRETLEANASHVDRQRLAESGEVIAPPSVGQRKDPSVTTFSDLRSSAAVPQLPPTPPKSGLSKEGARRRPKSAPTKVSFSAPIATHAMKSPVTSQGFIPVRIDFDSGDVTVVTSRDDDVAANLSAREPIMRNETRQSEKSFMREILETPKSMFDVPPPGTFPQNGAGEKDRGSPVAPDNLERDHYNNWMRSKGASSPYQVRLNKKRSKRDKAKQLTPSHDPMTNELISELAKRRIKKILDQKKRVDSGLGKNRPALESPKPAKQEQNSRGGSESLKRWRLREDLAQNEKGKDNAKKMGKSDKERRPVFTYNKKTKSKSIFHERNPVINQVLNT